jgi:shikimate dehydrogenase
MGTPDTKNFCPALVGSMSQGAAGNPTVAMVEAAFRHHDLKWRYVNMEVAPEDLATAVAGAKAMGFHGFNLSMPHKVTVIPLLDGLGESARVIGAVNCVVRRGNRLIGENTDGKGFLESLTEVVPPAGKEIVLFGAGGAARAVAVELALAGAKKITIVNRSRARGEELVGLLRDQTPAVAEFVEWTGDYVVQRRPTSSSTARRSGSMTAPPGCRWRLSPSAQALSLPTSSLAPPIRRFSARRRGGAVPASTASGCSSTRG